MTADTDIGQYLSVTTNSADPTNAVPTKVVAGPFFLTHASFAPGTGASIVQGSDCTVPEDKHIPVVRVIATNIADIHGIRIPVLAGQSLCGLALKYGQITVFGFKPY